VRCPPIPIFDPKRSVTGNQANRWTRPKADIAPRPSGCCNFIQRRRAGQRHFEKIYLPENCFSSECNVGHEPPRPRLRNLARENSPVLQDRYGNSLTTSSTVLSRLAPAVVARGEVSYDCRLTGPTGADCDGVRGL